MKLRQHAAARLQHDANARAKLPQRIKRPPSKRRRKDVTMLPEAVAPDAARRPGLAAEDRRSNRLLRTRRRASMMWIHSSLNQKVLWLDHPAAMPRRSSARPNGRRASKRYTIKRSKRESCAVNLSSGANTASEKLPADPGASGSNARNKLDACGEIGCQSRELLSTGCFF
jgi:hypothetical protein